MLDPESLEMMGAELDTDDLPASTVAPHKLSHDSPNLEHDA